MIHEELVKKEAVAEKHRNEITGCLKGLQVTHYASTDFSLVGN